MSKELSEQISATVRPLLLQAKGIYQEIIDAETALRLKRNELLTLALRLGKVLVKMKDSIGHGKWLFWLGGNWPEFGERNARRCMALANENPKSVDSTDLNADSVRKFMWGYIPEKDRPKLEGDEKVAPVTHQLTFVNNFFKFEQQIKTGHVKVDIETMRRDCEPMFKTAIDLLGREWFENLLHEK